MTLRFALSSAKESCTWRNAFMRCLKKPVNTSLGRHFGLLHFSWYFPLLHQQISFMAPAVHVLYIAHPGRKLTDVGCTEGWNIDSFP